MTSTLELDLLTPFDWRMLRAARLYALLDSPDAFASSYADESAWSQLDWQRSLRAATWIVAREAQHVIGLVKIVSEPALPASRYVESAWVAPTHRRRGVLRRLLDGLAQISHRMGVTELMLWVLEDNYAADRAYRALGFEPTGDRQYLPGVGRYERRLRLPIEAVLIENADSRS
jgi:ribosomal protein S18 acetylase RimI-like enzyme